MLNKTLLKKSIDRERDSFLRLQLPFADSHFKNMGRQEEAEYDDEGAELTSL